jgi:hypothetical protein
MRVNLVLKKYIPDYSCATMQFRSKTTYTIHHLQTTYTIENSDVVLKKLIKGWKNNMYQNKKIHQVESRINYLI